MNNLRETEQRMIEGYEKLRNEVIWIVVPPEQERPPEPVLELGKYALCCAIATLLMCGILLGEAGALPGWMQVLFNKL